MKRLVVGSQLLQDPHFRVMLDEAESACLNGEEVVFASCCGGCRACVANPHAGRIQCLCCSAGSRWVERRFKGRIKVVHFPQMPDCKKTFRYADVLELKDVVYKGVNIGYAAVSEYVSLTRDLLEDLTDEKRAYMDFLLKESCRYVDVAEKLLAEIVPDAVSVYNGRMFESRPFYELARLRDIPVRINEVVARQLDSNTVEFLHLNFENKLPQDVDGYAEKVRECWGRSSRSEEDRRRIASAFFEKRRNGIAAGDSSLPGHDGVFIQRQMKGKMPEGFDPSKHNIVIFNSSEDELCSVDKDFEAHALFLSHIEGIKTVAKLLANRPEYHVYLRIHPNLTGVNQPYHLKLYDLSREFSNLTVLPPDSKYSTYDLMDAAEKVVVLGSTAGVESTYWHRPVILIGSAMYYMLDVAYKPKSSEELESLLISSDIQPRPVADALKYGYYLTNNTEIASASRVVDLRTIRKTIHGKARWMPAWPSSWGLIYWILDAPFFNGVRRLINILARNVMPGR